MIRRQRRPRDIAFSFDSFLDVVANVVGIIIRLILVVWVGARSYSSVRQVATVAEPPAEAPAAAAEPADPLEAELAQHRRELAEVQAEVLAQLQGLETARAGHRVVEGELAGLEAGRRECETVQAALDRDAPGHNQAASAAAVSLAELREREQKLRQELRAVQSLPPVKHLLRYRTPVSRPVQAEEVLFECAGGRVAFIDIATLLADVKQGLEDKGQLLRTRWKVSDETAPVGAFRLRYTVERERELVDALAPAPTPEAGANFRYGVSEWMVEPVAAVRGETEEAALAAGSEFRRVVDALDGRQAAVTFWVYPDSFGLFRRLRDYLYDRELTVAARPLPAGVPITCSRHGSMSRGQ